MGATFALAVRVYPDSATLFFLDFLPLCLLMCSDAMSAARRVTSVMSAGLDAILSRYCSLSSVDVIPNPPAQVVSPVMYARLWSDIPPVLDIDETQRAFDSNIASHDISKHVTAVILLTSQISGNICDT